MPSTQNVGRNAYKELMADLRLRIEGSFYLSCVMRSSCLLTLSSRHELTSPSSETRPCKVTVFPFGVSDLAQGVKSAGLGFRV